MPNYKPLTISVGGQTLIVTPVAEKVFEYKSVEFISYEELLENADDYEDTSNSVEDIGILIAMSSKLHQVMQLLSDDERELIDARYFSHGGAGMSKREYAKSIGVTHKTVAYREKIIMAKLRKLLET